MHGVTDLKVRFIDMDEAARWDAFVKDHADGTVYHLAVWKRIFERAFGHNVYLLLAERGGVIEGVLPLVHLKSLIFGNSLSSMAFMVYGGPLVLNDRALGALEATAMDLARKVGARHIEYRSRHARHPDWRRKSGLYFTFRGPISADNEANLRAIPRKQRAVVRKGIANGLQCTVTKDVGDLHHIMAESYRNLGTPCFSRRYFRILQEELGATCEILSIRHEGRLVAAVMSFFYKDEVLPYYGGGSAAARRLGANDFMYWEVMRRAADRGVRLFDFGRSKVGTGAFNFKKYWGFSPEPLDYEFCLLEGDDIPDTSPLNPKYRLAIAAWRRLPLFVAKGIGPFISKHLG